MDTGGPWNSASRPQWLLPALIGGGVLLLLLLVVGALAMRGRSSPTPTLGRAASPTTRIILAGTPSVVIGGGTRITTTPPVGGVAPTVPPVGGGGIAGTTPTAAGMKVFVVSGTGGEGLILRDNPGGNQLTVLPDGTRLEQVGPDKDVNGVTWHNVKAPDGQTGWVAAQYTTESR